MKRLMRQRTWGWAVMVVVFVAVGTSTGWAATPSWTYDDILGIGTLSNVGIGTTTPAEKLHAYSATSSVVERLDTAAAGNNRNWAINNGGNGNGGLLFQMSTAPGGNPTDTKVIFDRYGQVGIGGVTAPAAVLHVGASTSGAPIRGNSGNAVMVRSGFTMFTSTPDIYPYQAQFTMDSSTFYIMGNMYQLGGWKLFDAAKAPALIRLVSGNANSSIEFHTSNQNVAGLAAKMVLSNTGNLGVGTVSPTAKLHVVGDAIVSGNIAAKYQDVAEWVPTKSALSPGTVVIIDPQATNQVLPAAKPYDTRVAGVVSTQPGLLLGEAGDDKAKIAHSGRVPVKVDASFGPIAAGDLLVTSPTPGYAMRSTPVDLGGVTIHRPGTLVGKALEPLAEGQGIILVLLTLQ